MKQFLRKSIIVLSIVLFLTGSMAGCGKKTEDSVTITVFAAKSLHGVMEELINQYQADHPDVEILGCYDGSGALLVQIEEGAPCDIFFPAAVTQMDRLEKEGLLVHGSRKDIVKNQLCVVTRTGSATAVTGLDTLHLAESMALADGSVPAGHYTRMALVNAGILPQTAEPATISTQEISRALGGLEINECTNVGAVAAAVAEGANEVGTVYYSDTYGYEGQLQILEIVSEELTGAVIYPAAQVKNSEADERQEAAGTEFVEFLTSKEAQELFAAYHFEALY